MSEPRIIIRVGGSVVLDVSPEMLIYSLAVSGGLDGVQIPAGSVVETQFHDGAGNMLAGRQVVTEDEDEDEE